MKEESKYTTSSIDLTALVEELIDRKLDDRLEEPNNRNSESSHKSLYSVEELRTLLSPSNEPLSAEAINKFIRSNKIRPIKKGFRGARLFKVSQFEEAYPPYPKPSGVEPHKTTARVGVTGYGRIDKQLKAQN